MNEKRVELSIKGEKRENTTSRLTLRLEMDGNDVNVVGCDENDKDVLIVSIMEDGKLWRFTDNGDVAGLRVNKSGQILEAK